MVDVKKGGETPGVLGVVAKMAKSPDSFELFVDVAPLDGHVDTDGQPVVEVIGRGARLERVVQVDGGTITEEVVVADLNEAGRARCGGKAIAAVSFTQTADRDDRNAFVNGQHVTAVFEIDSLGGVKVTDLPMGPVFDKWFDKAAAARLQEIGVNLNPDSDDTPYEAAPDCGARLGRMLEQSA